MTAATDRQAWLRARLGEVRTHSMALVADLSAEDCQIQSMTEASPVKWHLAHVTWFFETFVLERAESGFKPFRGEYRVLFNSYYVGIGAMPARPERGLLSRPSLDEVIDYRHAIDARIERLLTHQWLAAEVLDLIELGLHHEMQHQELILTDLKHHLSRNPLLPAYTAHRDDAATEPSAMAFRDFPGGLAEIGHAGNSFAFDNETPRHRVWLEPFALATRLVSNGEYLSFIEDGGYARPELWLSDGWACASREGWQAPLYWRQIPHGWRQFTLSGELALNPAEAVRHVSYYEADAYARWAKARLPTEAEWEYAATTAADDLAQMFGCAWQWTQSAYLPYPGYRPPPGAIGEYNGKFMVNQMVLRGGSCATPPGHARPSYRNFFPAAARWQFSGIRVAKGGASGAPPRQQGIFAADGRSNQLAEDQQRQRAKEST